jgi:hypothetical protein
MSLKYDYQSNRYLKFMEWNHNENDHDSDNSKEG